MVSSSVTSPPPRTSDLSFAKTRAVRGCDCDLCWIPHWFISARNPRRASRLAGASPRRVLTGSSPRRASRLTGPSPRRASRLAGAFPRSTGPLPRGPRREAGDAPERAVPKGQRVVVHAPRAARDLRSGLAEAVVELGLRASVSARRPPRAARHVAALEGHQARVHGGVRVAAVLRLGESLDARRGSFARRLPRRASSGLARPARAAARSSGSRRPARSGARAPPRRRARPRGGGAAASGPAGSSLCVVASALERVFYAAASLVFNALCAACAFANPFLWCACGGSA